jgi:hypothetical protein
VYDFLCCGPKGSKFENVRVRFFAQRLKSEPDKLKVVIQSIENEVIAEDPIYQGLHTESLVKAYLEQTQNQGWFIFPWEGKAYV